jgi:glycosyltransferase involved in cell wall biosynthesis
MATAGDAPGKSNISVTLVVPAYNEEKVLAPLVDSLITSLKALTATFEVVIVNDGSRDGTPSIADRLATQYAEVSVIHQENKGIGGALKAGIDRAAGDYLLLWPSDMQGEVEDLRPYLSRIGEADVIVGCRARRPGYSWLMRFNAWLYPYLVRMLFGLRLRDVNWIHMYRTRLIKGIHLSQDGIPMLAEILVKIRDLGGTFQQIGVPMRPRKIGVPSARRFRVMWRTLMGLFAAWVHWRRDRARHARDARAEPPLAPTKWRTRSANTRSL